MILEKNLPNVLYRRIVGIHVRSIAVLILVFVAPAMNALGEVQRTPIDVEGWTVHVDKDLLNGEEKQLGDRAIRMLGNHLQRVAILIPPKALSRLRDVEFCLDKDHPGLNGMQYHPSARWLERNGFESILARKIHICKASDLLSKEQLLKHPACVLHELAHAYHDQVLGFDHPDLKAVYEQATSEGKYKQVLLYTGKTVRHYGLNNHKEFFAEATEAYFYRNDFFPFVRAELAQYDPRTEAVLTRVWNDGPTD